MTVATPSGKDKLLRYARIYVGGYDLSGDALTFSSLDNTFGEADTTGWSEFTRNYIRDSRRTVAIRGFQALLNDTAAGAYTRLVTSPDAIVSLCLGGGGEPAVPDPAYLIYAAQMGDTTSFNTNIGMLTGDFLPLATQYSDNATNPLGNVLQGAVSLSATTTGLSLDNAAATTGGFHAHLHVLATASGNFAITIEHSTDDAAWATLATFTSTAGAITAERQTGTGTVNQYVRSLFTRTAGTTTAVVTFARG